MLPIRPKIAILMGLGHCLGLALPSPAQTAGHQFIGISDAIALKSPAHSTGEFGFSMANVGDVNADGFDDFVIGDPYADPNGVQDAGLAVLYSGQPELILAGQSSYWEYQILLEIPGTTQGDNLGYAVTGVGPVDSNDSLPDFAVSAPSLTTATNGQVVVYPGAKEYSAGVPTPIAVLLPHNSGLQYDYGTALEGVGDWPGTGPLIAVSSKIRIGGGSAYNDAVDVMFCDGQGRYNHLPIAGIHGHRHRVRVLALGEARPRRRWPSRPVDR